MRPERGDDRIAAERAAAADRQRRVDEHFTTHAQYWKQIYVEPTLFGTVHQQRRELALRWIGELALAPESRILELGCGAGVLAVDLARRGFLVHAVDVNSAMIDLAHREVETAGVGARVSLGIADAHELPFDQRTFDLVVALGVIPFLHAPGQGLREVARVLTDGGFVVFSNDNRHRLDHLLDPRLSPPFQPLRRGVRSALVRIGRRPPRKPRAQLPVTFNTIGDVRRWLAAAGLVELRCRSLGFGPFTLLGRPLLAERRSIGIHNALQRLADRGVPPLAATGSQHLSLATRAERAAQRR
jgi:ubiquinone/menaquinone biosynthesis C-methylase UbiE